MVPTDGSISYFHALAQFELLKHLPSHVIDNYADHLKEPVVQAVSLLMGHEVRKFHRLFMLPAVGHCGGSTGPSSIGGGEPEPPASFRTADTHVVSAMIKWVEEGAAPEKIVASRFDATGNLVRQRSVCPYPAQVAYNGSGDINSAASFSCASPKPNDRNIVEAGDLLHIRNALTQRELELPNR